MYRITMLLQYCLAIVVLLNGHAAEGGSVSIFEKWELESKADQCAKGWVCSETSCYHFSEEKATFAEALGKCRKFQSELVEINDEAEYEFLKSQNEHKNLPDDFWIALSDSFEEGKWIWMNSWNKVSFTKWHSGQPDDYEHSEDCVHMIKSAGSFKWNDLSCAKKRQFVCEK